VFRVMFKLYFLVPMAQCLVPVPPEFSC